MISKLHSYSPVPLSPDSGALILPSAQREAGEEALGSRVNAPAGQQLRMAADRPRGWASTSARNSKGPQVLLIQRGKRWGLGRATGEARL